MFQNRKGKVRAGKVPLNVPAFAIAFQCKTDEGGKAGGEKAVVIW